jgi:Ca2+-binding RTX toxin-like protein
LIGGSGNDTYIVDNVGDVALEDLNAGTDLIQSSVTYTLGANVENLTLTGIAAINGTGNAMNNILTGNSGVNNLSGGDGSDTLIGGGGADILTGLAGADTFRFALADSRLAAFDRITDFAIGTDILDGPTAVTATNLRELGSVSALTATAIGAVLTTTNFARNSAATFSFGSGPSVRTFLAINDGTAGFSSTSDGFIEITGYSGSLADLAIV